MMIPVTLKNNLESVITLILFPYEDDNFLETKSKICLWCINPVHIIFGMLISRTNGHNIISKVLIRIDIHTRNYR